MEQNANAMQPQPPPAAFELSAMPKTSLRTSVPPRDTPKAATAAKSGIRSVDAGAAIFCRKLAINLSVGNPSAFNCWIERQSAGKVT